HILEGLKIAVDHIDEVIRIIKKSKDTPAADAALRKRFKLSEKQSAEILNMRLARLTALEITKLEEELRDVRKFIKECKEFIASTHDYVMFFTQQGQCYWLKVHEIPQAARAARGKPMVSCIAIKPDERIAALVPVREFSDDQYLLFATKNGVVKKTVLSEFG